VRADDMRDREATGTCSVERALMYRRQADPRFRDELRRRFMAACEADAARRRAEPGVSGGHSVDAGRGAGAGRAGRDRNPEVQEKRVLRLPRIPMAYMGLATAAMVAIVIGIGNLIPRQPVAPDQPAPIMFSQTMPAEADTAQDQALAMAPAAPAAPGEAGAAVARTAPAAPAAPLAPAARGFAPVAAGVMDTAELVLAGVLNDEMRLKLEQIAAQAGSALEFVPGDAASPDAGSPVEPVAQVAHLAVERRVAEHVVSRIVEELGAAVEQPLSQVGSDQVLVVVRFSSN